MLRRIRAPKLVRGLGYPLLLMLYAVDEVLRWTGYRRVLCLIVLCLWLIVIGVKIATNALDQQREREAAKRRA